MAKTCPVRREIEVFAGISSIAFNDKGSSVLANFLLLIIHTLCHWARMHYPYTLAEGWFNWLVADVASNLMFLTAARSEFHVGLPHSSSITSPLGMRLQLVFSHYIYRSRNIDICSYLCDFISIYYTFHYTSVFAKKIPCVLSSPPVCNKVHVLYANITW